MPPSLTLTLQADPRGRTITYERHQRSQVLNFTAHQLELGIVIGRKPAATTAAGKAESMTSIGYVIVGPAIDESDEEGFERLKASGGNHGQTKLLLDSRVVSQEHIRIWYDSTRDKVYIKDCGSRNGTGLITSRGSIESTLQAHTRYELKQGHSIKIGKMVYRERTAFPPPYLTVSLMPTRAKETTIEDAPILGRPGLSLRNMSASDSESPVRKTPEQEPKRGSPLSVPDSDSDEDMSPKKDEMKNIEKVKEEFGQGSSASARRSGRYGIINVESDSEAEVESIPTPPRYQKKEVNIIDPLARSAFSYGVKSQSQSQSGTPQPQPKLTDVAEAKQAIGHSSAASEVEAPDIAQREGRIPKCGEESERLILEFVGFDAAIARARETSPIIPKAGEHPASISEDGDDLEPNVVEEEQASLVDLAEDDVELAQSPTIVREQGWDSLHFDESGEELPQSLAYSSLPAQTSPGAETPSPARAPPQALTPAPAQTPAPAETLPPPTSDIHEAFEAALRRLMRESFGEPRSAAIASRADSLQPDAQQQTSASATKPNLDDSPDIHRSQSALPPSPALSAHKAENGGEASSKPKPVSPADVIELMRKKKRLVLEGECPHDSAEGRCNWFNDRQVYWEGHHDGQKAFERCDEWIDEDTGLCEVHKEIRAQGYQDGWNELAEEAEQSSDESEQDEEEDESDCCSEPTSNCDHTLKAELKKELTGLKHETSADPLKLEVYETLRAEENESGVLHFPTPRDIVSDNESESEESGAEQDPSGAEGASGEEELDENEEEAGWSEEMSGEEESVDDEEMSGEDEQEGNSNEEHLSQASSDVDGNHAGGSTSPESDHLASNSLVPPRFEVDQAEAQGHVPTRVVVEQQLLSQESVPREDISSSAGVLAVVSNNIGIMKRSDSPIEPEPLLPLQSSVRERDALEAHVEQDETPMLVRPHPPARFLSRAILAGRPMTPPLTTPPTQATHDASVTIATTIAAATSSGSQTEMTLVEQPSPRVTVNKGLQTAAAPQVQDASVHAETEQVPVINAATQVSSTMSGVKRKHDEIEELDRSPSTLEVTALHSTRVAQAETTSARRTIKKRRIVRDLGMMTVGAIIGGAGVVAGLLYYADASGI